jgi:C4-dicarboxylate-specific signal transduction histidine kinase/ABC-type amino acid transport substrate-binding protein
MFTQKIFLKTIVLFFFIFLLQSNANQTQFKVSYDPDYAPFSYELNGKAEGLFVDFWRLWAEENHYNIKFINGVTWDNSINLAKEKKVDFFLGTNAYEDWMKSSKNYYELNTSLFIHKENDKGFSKDASYIIGIIGSDYEELLKENFKNSEIIIYKNYLEAFKDFSSRKIDLIYDDKVAIEYFALQNGYFHLIRSIKLFSNTFKISAISENENLVKLFDEGFKKLKPEDLASVESKWIIHNEQRIYEDIEDLTQLTQEEKDFIKSKTFKISLSKSWEPFSFVSINKPEGISTEIWELIAKKLGLKYEFFVSNNFSEQLSSIRNKEKDLIFSVGETKDRKEYALFTKPYKSFPLSIVTLKDENFIENMNYLFNKKIAVGENFTAHKILREKYPKLDFLLVKTIKEGLIAVKEEKAYAFVDIKPVLAYNIKKLNFDSLKITGNTGLKYDMSIMIRDDYKTLQSILNKAILSLNENEVNSIIKRWENVQFEKNFDYKTLWVLLGLTSLFFIPLIYFNQQNLRKSKNLKILVNERTKELEILNEELEERIEEKTKELRRANYLLDEAQTIAKLGSFGYSIKKKELKWSNEHYKIFGLFVGEMKPSLATFFSFIHPDDKKRVKKEFLKSFRIKRKYSFEFKILLRDETIKYIQLTSKITKFSNEGKPLFVIGTILDLTKIKKLELEKREQDTLLAQQSKMAAMGEMLENIAHQWRQPLSVISTASTGMQLQLEINKKVDEKFLLDSINSINKQSQYLSKTIEDFRNFFNPNKLVQYFDIKDCIEKSLYLVDSRLKKYNIEVIKDMENIKVKTLESELVQILLNILNNAIDAIESNKISRPVICINTYKENDSLIIEIKDNAGGIPKNIINRILEPYFTTKHKSQGTGIGLYMSNEIITKHLKGKILVSNCTFLVDENHYKGALFTLSLPIEAK